MKKNKNYSNKYKFKVALEMIRSDLTMSEIILKYQVPRSVLHCWKKQLLDNGSDIFGGSKAGNALSSDNSELDKLHATIGRLKAGNNFLYQVSTRLKL